MRTSTAAGPAAVLFVVRHMREAGLEPASRWASDFKSDVYAIPPLARHAPGVRGTPGANSTKENADLPNTESGRPADPKWPRAEHTTLSVTVEFTARGMRRR
jgi:hypothetical protein